MRKYVLVAWVALVTLTIAGCGSYNASSSQKPKPSGLTKRVLLSNQQTGVVTVMDAQKDALSTKTFGVTAPTKIVTSKGTTGVMGSGSSTVTIIDNATEAVTFSPVFADTVNDITMSTDGKGLWVAERNNNAVQSVDTTSGTIFPITFHITNANHLVMSPNGTKLLVFPDPQAQVAPNTHTFYVFDTSSVSFITVTDPSLDQPISGVFGASDTQIFILNCAGECGTSTGGVPNPPSVVPVTLNGFTAALGTPIPVPGATAGLFNGSSLYVAGTPQGANALTGPGPACPLSRCGTLTVINTGSLTAGTPVPITDGLHQTMALVNNKVYIGAATCTVDPGTAANSVRGCLTIFNTGNSSTVFPEESSFRQNFDVTGLQPISGRNVIYIVQGGELDIFDTTTDAKTATQIDVIGKAVDAVLIDP